MAATFSFLSAPADIRYWVYEFLVDILDDVRIPVLPVCLSLTDRDGGDDGYAEFLARTRRHAYLSQLHRYAILLTCATCHREARPFFRHVSNRVSLQNRFDLGPQLYYSPGLEMCASIVFSFQATFPSKEDVDDIVSFLIQPREPYIRPMVLCWCMDCDATPPPALFFSTPLSMEAARYRRHRRADGDEGLFLIHRQDCKILLRGPEQTANNELSWTMLVRFKYVPLSRLSCFSLLLPSDGLWKRVNLPC